VPDADPTRFNSRNNPFAVQNQHHSIEILRTILITEKDRYWAMREIIDFLSAALKTLLLIINACV